MNEHPSYLELDQLALGQAPSAEVAAHLSTCARCADHLATLRAPLLLPAGLERAVQPRRRWLGARRWLPLAAALAAACVLLLVAQLRSPEPVSAPTTLEKGMPHVAIYLKRGEQVVRWQSGEAVRPGDLIRLEIRPAGKRYLSITTDDGSGDLTRLLYEGALAPNEPVALPLSWQIDAIGERERLDVLLDDRPIAAAAHRAPPLSAYHQLITLPKRGGTR